MTVQALETREQLRTEIRRLADLAGDSSFEWTDKHEAEWKEANLRYDELAPDDKRMIGLEDRQGSFGEGKVSPLPATEGEFYRDTATGRVIPVVRKGQSFCDAVCRTRGYQDRMSEYDGLSLGRMVRALVTGSQDDSERRALSEGTDSAGGYTVPDILSSQLIDRLRTKSRVFQAGAATVQLDSDKHSFAKLLTDPTAGWRGEADAVAESDPTFGRIDFVPKTLAVMIKMSRELLEDSLNAEAAVNTAIANALANEVDRVALLGSGAGNEPTGMANMSGGINEHSMATNGAAVADYTDLLDAIQLLQEDNAGGTTAAIMAPRTLRKYSGMVDTTGQPLNRPKLIENLPFLETTQVPVDQTQGTATDASSIFLGDFSDLVIGFRTRMTIQILKERYANTMEVGFLAYLRCDVHAWHEQSLARIVGITP